MYSVKCKRNTNPRNITYSLNKNSRSIKRAKSTQFNSADVADRGGFVFTIPAPLGASGAISVT